MTTPLPTPSLVVLVGPPASGKSTWAVENFAPQQVVSSDQLRGVVGEHNLDLEATDDVFELIDQIITMRLRRKLTTVIDTTGLDAVRRKRWLDEARKNDVHTALVRFTTSTAECRRRNRTRPHPVPAKALDALAKKAKALDVSDEAWDVVLQPAPVRMVTPKLAAAAAVEPDPDKAQSLQSGLTFGLLISRFDWADSPDEIGPKLAQIARDAERAGFESLWVMDHMIQIPQVGRPWDPMLESYTTLGYLAQATTRLKLGVLVSAITFRNIGHLAKMIATLDVLSGGRAIAGLGAGNSKHEHDAYGWAFPEAPDRLALLEDALQALPLLWGPGSPSFHGPMLSIPEALSYPRPIQDPMPIIVGGSGEKITLRLAATYATGCNLFGDPANVSKKVAVLHEHCAAIDRDPAEIKVTHLGEVLVANNTQDLSERIDRLRPANQGPDRYAASVKAGTVDDHEAGFRQLAAAGVQTAILTTPDLANPNAFDALGQLIGRFQTH